MLKLKYRTIHGGEVILIGSPNGIADLYWQLTRNYSSEPDGTEIKSIKVTNLDGLDVTEGIMQKKYEYSTSLDSNLD